MIYAVLAALVRFLDACSEERRALADRHRRANDTPGAAPLTASKPHACPDRWAECVFAEVGDTEGRVIDHDFVVKSFTCETHGCAQGVSCPEELPKQAPRPRGAVEDIDAKLDALAAATPDDEDWFEERETETERERQASAAAE